ncbi:hypothetical protein C8R44DRAFT_735985 [Mycena epipterygia]|nr:hypothetical protein C8R44DRAFT_735985 [Mycena epipterygia]
MHTSTTIFSGDMMNGRKTRRRKLISMNRTDFHPVASAPSYQYCQNFEFEVVAAETSKRDDCQEHTSCGDRSDGKGDLGHDMVWSLLSEETGVPEARKCRLKYQEVSDYDIDLGLSPQERPRVDGLVLMKMVGRQAAGTNRHRKKCNGILVVVVFHIWNKLLKELKVLSRDSDPHLARSTLRADQLAWGRGIFIGSVNAHFDTFVRMFSVDAAVEELGRAACPSSGYQPRRPAVAG